MSFYSVDSESLTSAGSTILGISAEIEDLIGKMISTANSVDWTGSARETYNTANQEWQTAARNIQQAAEQIGRATGVSGTAYGETNTQVQGMFH